MLRKETKAAEELIKEILKESNEYCQQDDINSETWKSFVKINENAFKILKMIEKDLL